MSEQSSKDTILNKSLRVLTQQNDLTPEEVAQLRLSHLHLAGKTPSISFIPEGSQEPKVVMLDLETHRALVGWLVNRPDSIGDFLFPGQGDEAMDPAEIRRAVAQAEAASPAAEPAPAAKPAAPPKPDLSRPEEPPTGSASRPVRPLSRPEMGAPPPGVGPATASFVPPPLGPEEDVAVSSPLPASAPKSPPPSSRPPATASRPVSPMRPASRPVSRPEPPPSPAGSVPPTPAPAAKAADSEKTTDLDQTLAAAPKPDIRQEEAKADRPPEKPEAKVAAPPVKKETKIEPPLAAAKDKATAQPVVEPKRPLPRFLIQGVVVMVLLCAVCFGGVWSFGQSESGSALLAALGWSGDSAQEDPSAELAEATEEAVVFESALPTPTLPPTATPTALPPTDTPPPTDTATPIPTDTPVATATPTPTDTPVPTDTPEPEVDEPTPEPANTPTPGLKFAAPELLEPADEFAYIRGNTIVLRWKPVDLGPNEQYAVRLVYRFQGQPAYQGTNTTEPEWTVPLDLFGQIDGPENRYDWFVVIERLNDDGSTTAVSPESQRRSFTWK